MNKVDILKAYTDIFTRIEKFPGPLYKFQLKPNKTFKAHTGESSNSPTRGISSGNQEFGASRNSRTHQGSNRMGKEFHHSGEQS